MSITIKALTVDTEQAYECFLDEAPHAMLYHSIKYRNFLRQMMPDAKDEYLLAYEGNQLVGALPTFIKQGAFGAVVNSLPFYGSHGSILCSTHAGMAVEQALTNAFEQTCIRHGAVCSTVIENPLLAPQSCFALPQSDYLDQRIGQITALPEAQNRSEAEALLMSCYHSKTRNLVRKGMRSGFSVTHDGQPDSLKQLHRIHHDNLVAIGGLAKPLAVFETIARQFVYGLDYRIYLARTNEGEVASALLLLYYKDMVEYFTPATVEQYRADQPLSLLIYTAMTDAILEKKSRLWNWGGTWPTQEGVYHFKSRWGAKDYPYRYFIREYGPKGEMAAKGKAALLAEYPYFYTVPFSSLPHSAQ